MKIRTKIFALVATLSFVAIVTAAVGINTLQAYNQAVDDVRHAAARASMTTCVTRRLRRSP